MSPHRSRILETRAAIYADAVSEDEAAAHQNMADDIADLVLFSLCNWQAMPSARLADEPDCDILFADLADVLSDALYGVSSSHLQAIWAARKLPQ